jgi:hypothetical protein
MSYKATFQVMDLVMEHTKSNCFVGRMAKENMGCPQLLEMVYCTFLDRMTGQ